MPRPATRPLFLGLLTLGACAGQEFSEQAYCHVDCPVPPTNPPFVHWVFPATSKDTIYLTSVVIAGASDDRAIDHVELAFHDQTVWLPLTPSPFQAPPYTIELGRYLDTMRFHVATQAELRAIAVDIEGNADTALITVPIHH